jgi:hypothetical protein
MKTFKITSVIFGNERGQRRLGHGRPRYFKGILVSSRKHEVTLGTSAQIFGTAYPIEMLLWTVLDLVRRP